MVKMEKSKGVSFLGLLFLLFLGLKLTGHIGWSWWFVTMPLWIVTVSLILLFLIGFAFATFIFTISKLWNRKQKKK